MADKCLVNFTSQSLTILIARASELSGEMDDRLTAAGDILHLNLSEAAGELSQTEADFYLVRYSWREPCGRARAIYKPQSKPQIEFVATLSKPFQNKGFVQLQTVRIFRALPTSPPGLSDGESHWVLAIIDMLGTGQDEPS